MGDSETTGVFTRRRRATVAAAKGASLLPMDGKSGAACQNSVTADIRTGRTHGKRDRSLDIARSTGKSEKKKRRNDLSDRMRWVRTRMRGEKFVLALSIYKLLNAISHCYFSFERLRFLRHVYFLYLEADTVLYH